MSRTTIEKDLDGKLSMGSVKMIIAESWDLPRDSLRLIHKATPIEDSQQLQQVPSPGTTNIELTAVVCLELLCRRLQGKTDTFEIPMGNVRVQALRDLARLGPRCTPDALSVVCATLDECLASDGLFKLESSSGQNKESMLELALSIISAAPNKQLALKWVLTRFEEEIAMAADPAPKYSNTTVRGPPERRGTAIKTAQAVAKDDDCSTRVLTHLLLKQFLRATHDAHRQLHFPRHALKAICEVNQHAISMLVAVMMAPEYGERSLMLEEVRRVLSLLMNRGNSQQVMYILLPYFHGDDRTLGRLEYFLFSAINSPYPYRYRLPGSTTGAASDSQDDQYNELVARLCELWNSGISRLKHLALHALSLIAKLQDERVLTVAYTCLHDGQSNQDGAVKDKEAGGCISEKDQAPAEDAKRHRLVSTKALMVLALCSLKGDPRYLFDEWQQSCQIVSS
eukprot:gnl/TRDRNA2_/TRDRNA2_64496_c0_seq1.p1 gnl/TRDRNA2_/TRDRNA2_64496_c0~~gnl/TRDRNA2_/TRDRNA2_64496_c0_seq1.p1  ORF type:complete len:454 (-),score=56.09 gnl/TRDRNA2_/TRDRNA2_64496_c0_seq1:102-1463(-)